MGEPPVHLEVAGDGSKALGKLGQVKSEICRVELDPQEEEIRFLVPVLIGTKDVAVVAIDEVGHRGHNPFAVGAGDEKDSGGVHS